MKRLSLVVLIALGMTLMLSANAYGISDIITSQRIYPEIVSIDDNFTFCVLINKDNPCLENTINITYYYYDFSNPSEYQEGELYPLKEYIGRYHFSIGNIPETQTWCTIATAKYYYSFLTQFTCVDNLNEQHYDSTYDYIMSDHIFINTTSKFETERIYGKHVNESLEISVFLDDSSGMNINYTIYNITLGLPYKSETELTKSEGQFKYDFIIPPSVPYGFIEFKASGNGNYGGKFISFAAIPYTAKIYVDEDEVTMGNTIDIALDIALDYGEIKNTVTEITLPNGTKQNINLNHVNTSAKFKIDMQPGNYTIISTIEHSTWEKEKIDNIFNVNEYRLEIDRGVSVYEQADTVKITVGVIDSKNEIVTLTNVDIKIEVPNGGGKNYDEDDTTLVNNYNVVEYIIADDAELGDYTITVDATDEHGLKYSGSETFIVNERDSILEFTLSPDSFYKDIHSFDEVQKQFTIENTGTDTITEIEIDMEVEEFSEFVKLEKKNISLPLEPEDATTFKLIITPDHEDAGRVENGIYPVEMIVTIRNVHKTINVTINVSLTTEISILNESIISDALIDEEHKIYVNIENTGVIPLKQISVSLSGDLAEYESEINNKDELDPNSMDKITINLKPISKEGIYEGVIEIVAQDVAPIELEITLKISKDIKDDIRNLENERMELFDRWSNVDDASKISESIKEDLDELQADINDMDGKYKDGKYTEAKSLLTKIQNKAYEIDEALIKMEATSTICGNFVCDEGEDCNNCYLDCNDYLKCDDNQAKSCNSDDICNPTEDCTCEDCKETDYCSETDDNSNTDTGNRGSTLIIIVVIIAVVIIVVVVATSIVPDDFVEPEHSETYR